MTPADLLGLLAGALVLGTFATTNMLRLRLLAILSNLAFLAYATALGLWPVLVLHGLLLPVNIAMLYAGWRAARPKQGQEYAPCPYALPAAPRHFRPQASVAPQSLPTRNSQPG